MSECVQEQECQLASGDTSSLLQSGVRLDGQEESDTKVSDEDAADTAKQINVKILYANAECKRQTSNIGKFNSAAECAEAASKNSQCTDTFMFPRSGYGKYWGCACCMAGQGRGVRHNLWDVYQFSGTAPTPVPGSCGFETTSQPYCGVWANSKSDKFDWTRKTGRTSSWGTGPSRASSGSWYMYIETSWPRRKGDTAVLSASNVALMGGAYLSFGYHMYGRDIGSLQVKVNNAVVKTLSGNKGDKWLTEKVDLNQYASQTVTVSFVGERGKSWSGDIAIDDVKLYEGKSVAPTPLPPGTIKKIDEITQSMDKILQFLKQIFSTTTGPPVSGGLN